MRKGREEKSQARQNNNTLAIKQRTFGSSSRSIDNIELCSLSCFADTETPTRWNKLTICYPKADSPQTDWNQKVDDADSQLLHHQQIKRMSMSQSYPWTLYDFPRPPPGLDTHS